MNNLTNRFVGSLMLGGVMLSAGFMPTTNAIANPQITQQLAAQQAAGQTDAVVRGELSPEVRADLERVERGEFTGDLGNFARNIASEIESLRGEVSRAITSTTSNLPVRENLEAPAVVLLPQDTPLRNMLPRVPGSGLAAVWKQVVSLGGGWGTSLDQPGGAATRMFYKELGAPAEFTTVYATQTAAYKLMGAYGSVSNFAAAAAASYGNLKDTERKNCLANFMLNEENALINAVSTATVAPWGDGVDALAFDGLVASVATGKGAPADHIQALVGPLTLDHFNGQLTRLWRQGARDMWVLQSATETISLQKLLRDANEPYRLEVSDATNATLGFHVAKYVHPVSGQIVNIITDRFMVAGTMIFGCNSMPNGENAIEVEVLPQAPLPSDVQRPEGTRQLIQGYVVTELARTPAQPDVDPFMITCYEVLKVKSARHFCKSTGVTPAA